MLDAFLIAACSVFMLQVSQMLSAVMQAMPKEKGFTMCFSVLGRVGPSHFKNHLVENKLQNSEGWHTPRCPPSTGLGSVEARSQGVSLDPIARDQSCCFAQLGWFRGMLFDILSSAPSTLLLVLMLVGCEFSAGMSFSVPLRG